MILCMDANFRLKNQMVSNYSQDPGMGIGMAYLVPRKPYEAYALSRASDEDVSRHVYVALLSLTNTQISSCVSFQALSQANTRSSLGLRYTGQNMLSCGRSEMILPCGVGNLQKGERYVVMFHATTR